MTAARREGWIEWAGGENPVPGQRVEVRYRTGAETIGLSEHFLWTHWPTHGDIIAYRVVTAADDRGDGYEGACAEVSPTSVDEVERAVERVTGFLAEWEKSPSRNAMVYGLHAGHEREQELTTEDLRLILSRLAILELAYKADGEALAELEHVAVTLKAAFVKNGAHDGTRGAVLRRYPKAINAARSRLQARSVPSAQDDQTVSPEWRPIDTAPKDRFVMLYVATDGEMDGFVAWAKWQGQGWFGVDDHGLTFNPHGGISVTHWMPLPDQPESYGEGGR